MVVFFARYLTFQADVIRFSHVARLITFLGLVCGPGFERQSQAFGTHPTARPPSVSTSASCSPFSVDRTLAPQVSKQNAAKQNSFFEVSDYHSHLMLCESNARKFLSIRQFALNGQQAHLLVDPTSLVTSVVFNSCVKCQEAGANEKLNDSSFGQLLKRATTQKRVLQGDGLQRRGKAPPDGSFLTADLCPSLKPLDREFLAGLPKATPIAIAVSGMWIYRHEADFEWLKEQNRSGAVRVTWVNHSFTHPFKLDLPTEQNFLLAKGVNLENEIMRTERFLLARGVAPSVFFRTPGLIANDAVINKLKSFNLVPLSADAWLAKGQNPTDGSIILLHINGNEPIGIRIFNRLQDQDGIPLPLQPINQIN